MLSAILGPLPRATSTATGAQDLAIANHSSNNVSVLLGNGDGERDVETVA